MHICIICTCTHIIINNIATVHAVLAFPPSLLPIYHPHSCPHTRSTHCNRPSLSSVPQLDDSDIFESRASSAGTTCPSPHTPGPAAAAGKDTPLFRTHPFSYRSPQPTTPEPRFHTSR